MDPGGSDSVASASLPSSASYLEFPQHIKDAKGLWIFGESDAKRRVVVIERQNGSYGFTLQSYGVRYKHGHQETDFITYVNAIEKNSPAHQAGLREGDVILSVNGQNMARVEHKTLISFIRQCPSNLKMVVVSDERARKVELHMRYVHLQKKLQDKLKELEELSAREKQILSGGWTAKSGSCVGGSTPGSSFHCPGKGSCCFCPSSLKKREQEDSKGIGLTDVGTSTSIAVLQPKSDAEEAKLKQVIQERSKSVKLPLEKTNGSKKESQKYYYDCYRKCQSSRELHTGPAVQNVTGTSSSKSVDKQSSGHHHHHPVKPKSWDNLIGTATTKSFGGYGYGYGYGYFPSVRDVSAQGNASSCLAHPHHHNHHSYSHCTHYHVNKPSKHGGDEEASKVKVVYNYVSPTYHAMLPKGLLCANTPSTTHKNSCSDGTGDGSHHYRSKTLPSSSAKGTVSNSMSKSVESTFHKMEKTLSDSSLSDHYKEVSKTMIYFKRSGDNVRFPSDDELDGKEYRPHRISQRKKSQSSQHKAKSTERERIFV